MVEVATWGAVSCSCSCKEQNTAFRAGEVDALYAHTPYLEEALVKDDAVMLVEQTRGEVPCLANRQIHALVVQRSLLEPRFALASALVRAIARAEDLVHRSPMEAGVFARMFPERDRKERPSSTRRPRRPSRTRSSPSSQSSSRP